MRLANVGHALTLVALTSAALAVGAAYEAPRTFQASEVLPAAQAKGPHYAVAPTVKLEGYLQVFDLTTDYGTMEAEGRSMLATRVNEVRGLGELDKVSKSEVFVKAAGASVLKVGKGVTSVVTDPKATAAGMGQGIKRLGTNLGRKAKGAADAGADAVKKDDKAASAEPQKSTGDKAAGVAASIVGINGSARKWAQKVGVDPYTTNAVLKKALADIGKIDAAGGMAAKIAVPIPPVVGATASVGNMVWGADPDALLKQNEQKLKEIGVGEKVVKALYESKGLTLTLHTRLAGALREVNVPGCADYVETAAEADVEREGVFFADSAEMLARFHKSTPVAAVLSDSRALVAKTKDGRAVMLLPLDWVSWTAASEKAITEIEKRAKAELGAGKLELRITGKVSPAAKKELAARAWTVVEDVPAAPTTAPAPAK
jgi:hypothetical protein